MGCGGGGKERKAFCWKVENWIAVLRRVVAGPSGGGGGLDLGRVPLPSSSVTDALNHRHHALPPLPPFGIPGNVGLRETLVLSVLTAVFHGSYGMSFLESPLGRQRGQLVVVKSAPANHCN